MTVILSEFDQLLYSLLLHSNIITLLLNNTIYTCKNQHYHRNENLKRRKIRKTINANLLLALLFLRSSMFSWFRTNILLLHLFHWPFPSALNTYVKIITVLYLHLSKFKTLETVRIASDVELNLNLKWQVCCSLVLAYCTLPLVFFLFYDVKCQVTSRAPCGKWHAYP